MLPSSPPLLWIPNLAIHSNRNFYVNFKRLADFYGTSKANLSTPRANGNGWCFFSNNLTLSRFLIVLFLPIRHCRCSLSFSLISFSGEQICSWPTKSWGQDEGDVSSCMVIYYFAYRFLVIGFFEFLFSDLKNPRMIRSLCDIFLFSYRFLVTVFTNLGLQMMFSPIFYGTEECGNKLTEYNVADLIQQVKISIITTSLEFYLMIQDLLSCL